MLVTESTFTGEVTDTDLVPYHPSGPTTAKRSGGLTGTDDTCSMSSGLRCITDPDFQTSPTFIERDARWSSSPSILFENR